MGFHAGGGDLYDEDSVLCSVERGVSDILRLFVATQQLKGFVIGYLKIDVNKASRIQNSFYYNLIPDMP